MNTTDCEKIECKFGKEFNFHDKFDANFGEPKKDYEEVSEMSVNKVEAFNAIEKQYKDHENYIVKEEFALQPFNSCEEKINESVFGSLTNINKATNNASANLTKREVLQSTEPTTCTALVFTPAEEHKLPAQFDEMTEIYDDDDDDTPVDFDDGLQPLSERWSPLGANYDDAVTPSSELLSPESELELLSSDSQDKHDFHQQHEYDATEMARLKGLEEEQEMLTSSLMALTSHFAHVQLRVRQIVEAPANERDQLLKDLEEFAFQGIPETPAPKVTTTYPSNSSLPNNRNAKDSASSTANTTNEQQQFELIDHLKNQLIEIEKIAYESGAPVLPQHVLLEKQKIIIDELKQKLNFKFDENKLPELSAEELKSKVDNAIGEFVGPLKMKEQLVAQLKTQITDLERFIAFLQCDTDESKMKTLNGSEKLCEAYNSYAAKKKNETNKPIVDNADVATVNSSIDCSTNLELKNQNSGDSLTKGESLHSKAHGLMDKASLLMQMFATTHFGSKQEQFQKNSLKKTHKGNHWGDLRAQLEVDIQEVASLAATLNFDREKLAKLRKAMKKSKTFADTEEAAFKNGIITKIPPSCSRNYSKTSVVNQQKQLQLYTVSSGSDDDDLDAYDYYDWQQQNNRRIVQCTRIRGDTINTLSKELTAAVRKNFAMTLMKLMQHGLRVEIIPATTSSLIVPFMRCLNPSPVFVAEHNSRARDSDAYSFMSSTASFGYEDSEGKYSDNGNGAGFFSTGNMRPMHAWELILEYYYLKHGDEYNNTPARKLSQSFNLDIVNSQVVTVKQNLLSVVGSIVATHRPYKRSYNAHFKAFVCAGLNCQQLVEWLNLILSCTDLIENYYTHSSYVACTGFRDALRSIDTLSKYDFDLPVDLAIRHFRNL